MCGRFTLHSAPERVAELFDLPEAPLFEPRYNIAPSQSVAAVRIEAGRRRVALLRWGLIPFWASDPKIAYQLINARSETAATKPAFRDAFRRRRCLIVADGFFEWKKQGKTKQPFCIRRTDSGPFGFAGLWERWQPPQGDPVETCTILTTNANGVLAPLHERMPVILEKTDHAAWLDPQTLPGQLQVLLRPLPDEVLMSYPVSSQVNSPKNDDPTCIASLPDSLTSEQLFPPEGP